MTQQTLRVAVIGPGFMGRAHSQGWLDVARHFPGPIRPELGVLCGRDTADTDELAERFGWPDHSTDWRSVVERDDVDLVDICTPQLSHADIAVAALAAGKHVVCEKPLAGTVADAERMVQAAADAAPGVVTMTAFNYRRIPAIELTRQMIDSGRLGTIRHVHASYRQNWAIDPELPRLWRFDQSVAGTGAIGDLASHVVDLVQHLARRPISRLAATTRTFIGERPDLSGSGMQPVTVDDAAEAIIEFDGGATGSFDVTRLAPGRKNSLIVEISGSLGTVRWDLERLNELEVCIPAENGEGADGFTTVNVTEPDHPWIGAWWPPGHLIGWQHTFAHEFADLLAALAEGTHPQPDFASALQVQRVLEAIGRSADEGRWVDT